MIERVVYSYWTAPQGGAVNKMLNWCNARSALMCACISVAESKKKFKEVVLVTDDLGFDLLVKQLGLPFDEVSVSLNKIDPKYKDFWSLGKVVAYSEQTKPFLHLDFDAILFNELSDSLLASSTFAQHLEVGDQFDKCYVNQINVLKSLGIKVPNNFGELMEASCLGIVGFNDLNFLNEYCKESLKFIYDNGKKLDQLTSGQRGGLCVVFEQYVYNLIAQKMGIKITHFSECITNEDIDIDFTSKGYTHIWGYKMNPIIEGLLLRRLMLSAPQFLTVIDNILKT